MGEKIHKKALHKHHLSGKSSQIISLAILGAAAAEDPQLNWLEDLLSPIPPFGALQLPTVSFERALPRSSSTSRRA